jgi:hypothetical protein
VLHKNGAEIIPFEPDADNTAVGCGTMNKILKPNTLHITRKPFPNSKKIYVKGSRDDILVGMREIQLSPTRTKDGTLIPNEPVIVYDTSGTYIVH